MQMICVWPKIWTLSGRLKIKYIPCVPHHIRIIVKKNNWLTWHETDRFLNNLCQECVRAYLSIHAFLSFLHEVMIGNHRICIFLVAGNIFRLETCMNSLVKVSPYSKLNFQGRIFFTQNWCNITLISLSHKHQKKLMVFLGDKGWIGHQFVGIKYWIKNHNKIWYEI